MKVLILVLAGLCLAQALSLSELEFQRDWLNFKVEYDKSYDTEEEELYRMRIYADNRDYVARHNEQYRKGHASYSMGENKFSDMTAEEFLEIMTGGSNQTREALDDDESLLYEPDLSIPLSAEKKDWRQHGAVSPVKDQGNCGSCWSFAVTGVLESHYYIRKKRSVSLSEQNLMDCSWSYGNSGCNGGSVFQAYKYIKDNRGIDTEGSYPYLGRDSRQCRFKRANVGATMSDYKVLRSGSEMDLLHTVDKIGPVSVEIQVLISFKNYKEGVYYEPKCSAQKPVTHGVLVVGYGVEKGHKYWLVKNSWGTDWGDHGYIKMARNRGNNCQIATYPSFPVVN